MSLIRSIRILLMFNGRYNIRTFSSKAYEADGKTKAHIVNSSFEEGVMVTAFNQYGFRLNNNMSVVGPMAIFPRSALSWNIKSHKDINENSLSIFFAIEPKINMLVLGIGERSTSKEFSKTIVELIMKYKINIEVLRTDQACATLNFLTAENRMVAAGLIPPLYTSYNEMDVLNSKLRRNNVHEIF